MVAQVRVTAVEMVRTSRIHFGGRTKLNELYVGICEKQESRIILRLWGLGNWKDCDVICYDGEG